MGFGSANCFRKLTPVLMHTLYISLQHSDPTLCNILCYSATNCYTALICHIGTPLKSLRCLILPWSWSSVAMDVLMSGAGSSVSTGVKYQGVWSLLRSMWFILWSPGNWAKPHISVMSPCCPWPTNNGNIVVNLNWTWWNCRQRYFEQEVVVINSFKS